MKADPEVEVMVRQWLKLNPYDRARIVLLVETLLLRRGLTPSGYGGATDA